MLPGVKLKYRKKLSFIIDKLNRGQGTSELTVMRLGKWERAIMQKIFDHELESYYRNQYNEILHLFPKTIKNRRIICSQAINRLIEKKMVEKTWTIENVYKTYRYGLTTLIVSNGRKPDLFLSFKLTDKGREITKHFAAGSQEYAFQD